METLCGASWISRSAGKFANNKEIEVDIERKSSNVSPDYDTHSTLTDATKPSAVEKVPSSDCNATQHATKRQRERLQKAS
jgi:hypothetical protein